MNDKKQFHMDWPRSIPFIGMHVGIISLCFVDFSLTALLFGIGFYCIRMLAITGFYHRYFAHRAFKTSRWFQFVGACVGAASVQRGPLWWAAHHRDHHLHSDTESDVHSPTISGFWFSHMGWFMTKEHFDLKEERIRDFSKYPELMFITKYDTVVPALFFALCLAIGWSWQFLVPAAEGVWALTIGQMIAYSFFASTVVLYHATFCVNSLLHLWGTRPYKTADTSRNNALISIIVFGEGWHNNHHHFQSSARNGFRWWEFDPTFWALKMLSWVGIVWDLKEVPPHIVHLTADAEVDKDEIASGDVQRKPATVKTTEEETVTSEAL